MLRKKRKNVAIRNNRNYFTNHYNSVQREIYLCDTCSLVKSFY